MPSPSRITTVVTPANSLWLVDLDAAKDELGIDPDDSTQDGKLGRAIGQLSAAVGNHCGGRIFVRQSYRDQFRDVWRMRCGDALILDQAPIATDGDGDLVLTVSEDGTTVALSEWEVDRRNGLLYRLGSAGGFATWAGTVVTVEYDAGFDLIPEDLQAAALRWLTARWSGRGRDPAIRSLTIPDVVSETYVVESAGEDMPSQVKKDLAPYCFRTV